MKKVISALALVGMTLAHGLNIGMGERIAEKEKSSYPLSCEGAHGAVKYYIDGLPYGVELNGATIVIYNYARAGNYTIRIRAVD